jgi:putative inorganic carbon (hco3(-)) transporter
MREALLIALVIGLCLASVHSSKIALIGYIWFAIMRPDVLAWAEDHSFSLILGAVAVISCVRDLPNFLPTLRSRWFVVFLAYISWILLSVAFSSNLSASSLQFRFLLPTAITAVLIPVVITTFKDIRRLYIVMAASLGILGFKFGAYGLAAGGAYYAGGYGGSLSDNNLFALAMVIALPLCWYARELFPEKHWKLFFLGLTFCIIPTVIMTHSRGGALAMAITLLFMGWYSRRRVLTLVILAVLTIPGLYLVRDSFTARMSTISTYEEDHSAQTRLAQWKAAVRMSLDYPIFGVGFGGGPYTQTVSRYIDIDSIQYAHNNYLQTLADSGYPALVLLCILLFGQIFYLRRLALNFKRLNDFSMYGMAMGMASALVGFAAGSVFLSRTYYETIYYMFAFTAALQLIAPDRLQAARAAAAGDESPDPSPAPTVDSPIPFLPTRPAPDAPPARYKLGGRERVHRT